MEKLACQREGLFVEENQSKNIHMKKIIIPVVIAAVLSFLIVSKTLVGIVIEQALALVKILGLRL